MNLEQTISNQLQFGTIFKENDQTYLKIVDRDLNIQKIAVSLFQTERGLIKISGEHTLYVDLDELVNKLHLNVEVIKDLKEGKTEALKKAHFNSLALLMPKLLKEAEKLQDFAIRKKMSLAFNEHNLSQFLIENGPNALQIFSGLIQKYEDEQIEKIGLEQQAKNLKNQVKNLIFDKRRNGVEITEKIKKLQNELDDRKKDLDGAESGEKDLDSQLSGLKIRYRNFKANRSIFQKFFKDDAGYKAKITNKENELIRVRLEKSDRHKALLKAEDALKQGVDEQTALREEINALENSVSTDVKKYPQVQEFSEKIQKIEQRLQELDQKDLLITRVIHAILFQEGTFTTVEKERQVAFEIFEVLIKEMEVQKGGLNFAQKKEIIKDIGPLLIGMSRMKGGEAIEFSLHQKFFATADKVYKLGKCFDSTSAFSLKDLSSGEVPLIVKLNPEAAKREYEMLSYLHQPLEFNPRGEKQVGIQELHTKLIYSHKNRSVVGYMANRYDRDFHDYIVTNPNRSFDDQVFQYYQLLKGLETIHALGVIHCDIKAQNILKKGDFVDIADFEGAQKKENIKDLTKINDKTTTLYMNKRDFIQAKELARKKEIKEFIELREKMDLFAMGCLFYYSITGAFFSHMDWANGIVNLKPSHLSSIKNILEKEHNTPPELAKIVCNMLDPDPSSRPPVHLVLSQFTDCLPSMSYNAYDRIIKQGWIEPNARARG